MKKLLLILLSFILFTFDGSAQNKIKYYKISAYIEPESLQSLFSQGLEIDHFVYEQDKVLYAEVSDNDLKLLKNAKVKYTLLEDDLEKNRKNYNESLDARSIALTEPQALVATPSNFALGSYAGFYTYQEMQNILDQMRAAFPNLISVKSSIGNSLEGRPIFMVRISDNPDVDENEPELMFNALHHAREPMSMSQMIFFMWHLLENYNSNEEIKTLVNSSELYLVPMVNPDGYVYNQSTNPAGGGMWRKNRRNNGNGTFGVDLNRNYGLFWGYDNTGSSPTPSSDTYRGTAAFSEPETQVLRNFCNAHQFGLSLDYHSYGNYCIYPYSHVATNNNPELALFQQLSNLLTAENGFISGNSNQTVSYLSNGQGNDWRYGEQTSKPKTYAFVPEVGTSSDGFWPAQSRIIQLCNSTVAMNLNAMRAATNFASLTASNTPDLSGSAGQLAYSLKNFNLKPGNYTVSMTSTSPYINNIGVAKVYSNMTFLQSINDGINFGIDPNTPVGSTIHLVISIDNGYHTYTQTISRSYQCAPAPSNLAQSNISQTSANLSWAAVAAATGYKLEYKMATATIWTTAAANLSTTSFVLNSLTAGTQYQWRVSAICGSGAIGVSAAGTFSTTAVLAYCASRGSNSTLVFIDYVRLGSINRVSGNDGGYYNGTAISTNAALGSTQTITFSSGFASTTYRQYWRVWIDYNKNGVFTDAGEQVVSTNITGSGNGTASFVIPATALTGATRMRVASKNGSYPTSCQTFSYGEVEDYTINITASAARIAQNVDEQLEDDLIINQNPFSDVLRFKTTSTNTQKATLWIVNSAGKQITQKEIVASNIEQSINTTNWKPGLYIIFYKSNKKVISRKIVKAQSD